MLHGGDARIIADGTTVIVALSHSSTDLSTGGDFNKRCLSALKQLRQHKWAWVFEKPVDAEGLGLHDYNTVSSS